MNNKGYTIIEIVVVALLVGIVASVAIPRAVRSTPSREVYRAARELVADLEQVRTRAVANKRVLRVRFEPAARFYTAFVDTTADYSGVLSESEAEVRGSRLVIRGASGGLPGVSLPDPIVFSSGSASTGPAGRPTGGVVISSGAEILDFDARGLGTPLGTTGVVYLSHAEDPEAVAAVTISGAGSFQAWRLIDGDWVR